MKLTCNVETAWFLALHTPGPWQWPIIAAMAGLAVVLLGAAYKLYRRTTTSPRT